MAAYSRNSTVTRALLLIFTFVVTTAIFAGGKGGLRTLVYPPFKHTWGVNKGTEAKLDMLLGNATDFDNTQGIAVTRRTATDNPKDDRDDDELSAYGVNAGRDQIIYNVSMYNLAIYGSHGSGVDCFDGPTGIVADPSGDVFVCDTGNRRIVHLVHEKKGLKWVGSFGEDILLEPHDIASTESGTLFVTDRGRGTIDIFTDNGEHVGTLEGLVNPRGIAVDNPSITKTRYGDRAIYVIDGDGSQIRKMNYEGRVLATARASDIPGNTGSFKFVALDFYDNAWISDSAACRIYKFDKDLKYIIGIGECGDGDYQFENPTGIAIWRRFGQVVVAESHSAQYFWVGCDIAGFEIAMGEDRNGNDAAIVDVTLTDRGYVTIAIEKDGQPVRKFLEHKRFNQGIRTVKWDLKDDSGARVPAGEYRFELLLEPTYSSYGYFDKTIEKKAMIDG